MSSPVYRPGDLVRLIGHPPLHAEVVRTSAHGLRRGRLEVRSLAGRSREVLTRDVVAHWRRVR